MPDTRASRKQEISACGIGKPFCASNGSVTLSLIGSGKPATAFNGVYTNEAPFEH
jgi:hypothetical protein